MNTDKDFMKWMILIYLFILLFQTSIKNINPDGDTFVTVGDSVFGKYITEVNGTITTNPSTVNSDGMIVEGETISAGDSGIGWFDDFSVIKNYIFGTLGFLADLLMAPINVMAILSTLGLVPEPAATYIGVALFLIFMISIISYITKR